MGNRIDTQVLIAGGGPVGMTLAIDLARRGIQVTVAELRAPGAPPSVRCNHIAARTMETFRRLGLVQAVRNAGLPAEYPNDVVFRTTAIGIELSRIPLPCRAERYTAKGGPDTWWPTPEPPHRINQMYLEPVLLAYVAATPRLIMLNRTRVIDYVQRDRGVRATVENLDGGGVSEVLANYLVGCDGAHSGVRHIMGAKLSGDAVVMQTQSTYIRAPQLLGMMQRPAWLNVSLNPRCAATFSRLTAESDGSFTTGVLRLRIWQLSTAIAASGRYSVWTRLSSTRFSDRRIGPDAA